MVFHFREIVENYSRSFEIIIQIPIFYSFPDIQTGSVEMLLGASRTFFSPFTNALFLERFARLQ